MNAIKKSCVLGILLSLAMSPLAFGEPHVAMWKSQDVRFIYRGYVTTYRCQILGSKVRAVLHAIGAHESTTIQAESCNVLQLAGGAPAQVASMRITLVSPALATPELRAELASTAARAELLERFGARSRLDTEFQAVWQQRDLASLRMDSGDCELLQQLREQVLSKLAVQILGRDGPCSLSPHRLRKPTLRVLTLLPVPHADTINGFVRDRS